MKPQQLGIGKENPEIATIVGDQLLDGADGQRLRARLLKNAEGQPVKAEQTLFRTKPKISVRRLRDRRCRPSWELVLDCPTIVRILRNHPMRIDSLRGSSTENQHCDCSRANPQP